MVALESREDDPDRLTPPRMLNTFPEKEDVLAAGDRVAGDVIDLFKVGALE